MVGLKHWRGSLKLAGIAVIKQPFKEKKQSIILKGGVTTPMFFKDKITDPVAEEVKRIISGIYFENSQVSSAIFQNLTDYLENDDKILRPLLAIISLGTSGVRAAHTDFSVKPLKVVVNADKNIKTLVAGGEKGLGIYRGKNTVYIAGDNKAYTFATMLHEWKHFVDKEIFGQSDISFTEPDAARFMEIKKSVRDAINTFPTGGKDQVLSTIKASFAAVFSPLYKENDRNVELLARVPEVLGALGLKDGRQWLETYVPELIKFYEDTYNKHCIDYLSKQSTLIESATPNLML